MPIVSANTPEQGYYTETFREDFRNWLRENALQKVLKIYWISICPRAYRDRHQIDPDKSAQYLHSLGTEKRAVGHSSRRIATWHTIRPLAP